MDVYSYGVIAYEMISRKLLFQEMIQHRFDEEKIRVAVQNGERPPLVDAYPLETTSPEVK